MLGLALGGSLITSIAIAAPLGAALGITGLIILEFFAGGSTEVAMLGVWNLTNSFTLSAVPMFILIGNLLVAGGLSKRIYGSVAPWFVKVPGGLQHSNVVVSTLFGAVSGSSAATSAAVGSVAYREMRSRGYDPASVAACLAASGTIGLLIPPSLSLLIYGAWQEVSIGRLFMAGVVPGLLIAALFMAYLFIDSFVRPAKYPRLEDTESLRAKLAGLYQLWPLILLVFAVLGSIYTGIATITESAALGVVMTALLGSTVGTLTPRRFVDALIETAITMGVLIFVLVGATILAQAVMVIGLPKTISDFVIGQKLSSWEVLLIVVVFYLLMGIFFDGISLMLTTVPFIYPMMVAAGFDPVWIGIFVTIMIEIGMLTPPIGVNIFVVMSISGKEVSLGALSMECLPYWLILFAATLLLAAFPGIVLFLPDMVYN